VPHLFTKGHGHNNIRVYAARAVCAMVSCLSQLAQKSVEAWFGEHSGAQSIAGRQRCSEIQPCGLVSESRSKAEVLKSQSQATRHLHQMSSASACFHCAPFGYGRKRTHQGVSGILYDLVSVAPPDATYKFPVPEVPKTHSDRLSHFSAILPPPSHAIEGVSKGGRLQ
jgi:hypothetical protein